MTGPASSPRSAKGAHPPTLAQRNFPRRVRAILEGVLEFTSGALEQGLQMMLDETEQHLFKLAEQARSNQVQKQCFEALREVRRTRPDFIPRFMLELEAALARIHDPRRGDVQAPAAIDFSALSLVEDVTMDEDIVLNEIAARTEIRSSLPLFLLGQRFGVIAGRPAFDCESLPVGPHGLCRVLRAAAHCFDVGSEHRQLMYRQFDRMVLQFAGPLFDALNDYLIKQGILPHLTFVPVRAKPTARREDKPEQRGKPKGKAQEAVDLAALAGFLPQVEARPAPRPEPAAAAPATAATPPSIDAAAALEAMLAARPAPKQAAPLTAWPNPAVPAAPEAAAAGGQDVEMFDVLRQLLAGRRSLLGKLGGAPAQKSPNAFVPSTADLQSVLQNLQRKPATPVLVDGKPAVRSIGHLKQDLLAQLRQLSPDGKAPALSEEDGDSIDLVGMLFEHLMRDVRPNSPAAALLSRLQVPLLRVALEDKAFFTRRQHPARQMLNAIAETGAHWLGGDEGDRELVEKLRLVVDRVNSEFSGDSRMFTDLLGDLSQHLQLQARKAEVAEKRHVESARGREKLELARLQAAEAIDAKLAGKRIPKFLHTLLAQAWSDVLSLTLLRQGEDSEAFRHQLHLAERLIESAVSLRTSGTPLIPPSEAHGLRDEIEQALVRVGYHAEDAQAVSARLLSASVEEDESDPASRTELAMRLKARTRLGQGQGVHGEDDKASPLSAEERAALERIKHLPFGAWMEFTVNQQGDRVRRRLSWYSTVTGHCLFVNARGQRVGEYSLNWLARELHRGNVRVVEAEPESLIDRAWHAVIGALRSFAGRSATPPAA